MSVGQEPDYVVPSGVTPDASPTVPSPEVPAPSSSPAGASASDGSSAPSPTPSRADHRIRELIDERRRIESDLARTRAEAEFHRRQVEALTGVKREAEADPQEQAIREQLERIYPGLKQLQALDLDQIKQLLETVPQLRAQAQSQYDALADQTVSALYAGAQADLYGGRELTPQQQHFIHRTFVAWVESDPTNIQRYTFRDPKLVPDFLKLYTAEMLEPIRRTAAVQVGQRVSRVASAPTGGGSSGPVGTPPPTVPLDEDARHEAAWQALRGKLGG